MPVFVPGLDLCRQFYFEAVRPIIDDAFPGLRYSAARIGSGSEVLGFDDEVSTDHDWGPGLLVFLEDADAPRLGEAIRETLARRLPREFRGYPTGYAANEDGTLRLAVSPSKAIAHSVATITVAQFFDAILGFDVRSEIEAADWLTFPEQKLCAITCGAVFRDDIGLQTVRDRFAYYPRDVWLYLLAAAWNRIGQEEHVMGRAGGAGDELGSAIIGSRLVRDLMRLCFLLERRYAPYPKWFGTAFRCLSCASRLEPILIQAVNAATWQEREAALVLAYEVVATLHNSLGLTDPLPTTVGHFHNRPFRVIHLGGGFAGEIVRKIQDPVVQHIARRRLLGGIDLISDNTDLLCGTEWRTTIRQLYENLGPQVYENLSPPDDNVVK